MFRQLRKTLVATLIAAVTVGQVLPAFADSSDSLPDMGTTAGSTLSIGQEMQMGDYYVRQLRGSAPLINDPSAGAIHQRSGNASGGARRLGKNALPLLFNQ